MRNKLKKIWNKEDGFTLVELLGVIVILGIILAIAIPGIGTIVDNARTKTAEQQELLVIDAAKLYFVEKDVEEVTVEDLISAGFLEKNDDFNKNAKVTVSSGEYKIDPALITTP